MTNKGVHTSHCCVYHGCKYGDPDCPVWNMEIVQEFPCEECEYDACVTTINYIDKRMSETQVDNVEILAELAQLRLFVFAQIREDKTGRCMGDMWGF